MVPINSKKRTQKRNHEQFTKPPQKIHYTIFAMNNCQMRMVLFSANSCF